MIISHWQVGLRLSVILWVDWIIASKNTHRGKMLIRKEKNTFWEIVTGHVIKGRITDSGVADRMSGVRPPISLYETM